MAPRILVVEDDLHFAGIVTDFLTWTGCEVRHATTDSAALDTLETWLPDALLVNVSLPQHDGVELTRRIKAGAVGPPRTAERPVVLMSAVIKDDAAIRAAIRSCGADDYLVKPFAMGDLQAVLTRLIPSHRPAASPATGGDSLAHRGRVEPGVLAPLLLRIRRDAHTGVLRLEAPPHHKSIVFVEGRPLWAEGSGEHDRLGTMLLEEGTISRAQFAEAIAWMRSDGVDFGSALTSLNILTPGRLFGRLRNLVARRIVSAFRWTDGQWTLSRGVPETPPSFETELLPAVLRGLEAHVDASALWSGLEPMRDRFVVPTARFFVEWPALKTGEGIGALGPFLTGRRTLRRLELMEVLPKSDFQRAIWLLHEAGMVVFSETADEGDDVGPITVSMGLRSSRPPAQIEDLIERVLGDYFRLGNLDYFRLFELSRSADDDEVAEGLQDDPLGFRAEELKRDIGEDVRDIGQRLLRRVSEARTVLGSPADRGAYREGLDGHGSLDEAADDEAAIWFDQGRGLLRTHDFREAAVRFERAVRLSPESAVYLAYAAWARYRSARTEDEAQAAVERIDEAIRRDDRCATAHFFRGVVHRDVRRYAAAVAAFESALRYDPGLELARAGLREARELSGLHRTPGH